MPVQNVNGTNSYSSTPAAQPTGSGFSKVDAGQFMTLLMAQLTHQNPLEPMSDSEMMSQFAQLNSLTELQGMKSSLDSLATSSQATYAASLIGKNVKATRSDGSILEGVVSAVIPGQNQVNVQIGDEKISLDRITEITGG